MNLSTFTSLGDRISGVMVSALAFIVVARGFESRSGQTKDYKKSENTKGVIRIRISKKNRQHNDQKKKYTGTNYELQYIHIKLKIE
jgi:hypothetical protein